MEFIPPWAIGGAVIIFAGALAQIVVVKLRASVRTLPRSDSSLSELRRGLEAMQDRVGELEERLDFTERVLTKYRDAERLEPPPP